MKVTDWISSKVKPTIPGWYERKWGYMDNRRDCMDYWDGYVWRHGDGKYGYDSKFIGVDNIEWRGLAEKP